MSEEIKESINEIQGIVDFYELDDENNYDYSDKVLISMRNLLDYIASLQQKVEQLKKENNDLRKIYQNTYKKYLENGNEEMAHYFMAQIDACPTFYVEPVIDYYKEYHRLENIIKEAITYILAHCEIIRHIDENVDEVGNVNGGDLLNILNKGSDKE